jgi:nucleotide-binding universal stress UspA family protein
MKILVPVDDRLFASIILDFLCKDSCPKESTFRILHVVTPIELAFFWPNETHQKAAEQLVQDVVDCFRKAFPEATVEGLVVHGPPAKMILEEVTHMPADFVAMGSHSRSGLGKLVLGSVSHEVALRCKSPLAVLRPGVDNHQGREETECFFEGEKLTREHRKYLSQHRGEYPFPVDGSDWSRLVQMRLAHDHKAEEPACDECRDFLSQLHSGDDRLSHELSSMRLALHHWFLTGTNRHVVAGFDEAPTEQILRNLELSYDKLTPERAERDWVERHGGRTAEKGRYWITGRGEAFESAKQLPDRLERQTAANRLIEKH